MKTVSRLIRGDVGSGRGMLARSEEGELSTEKVVVGVMGGHCSYGSKTPTPVTSTFLLRYLATLTSVPASVYERKQRSGEERARLSVTKLEAYLDR